MSEDHYNELSTDQKYLLEMYQAVSTGICDPNLAARNPGKIAHSRWLTTASTALCVDVSTYNPSNNFKLVIQ